MMIEGVALLRFCMFQRIVTFGFVFHTIYSLFRCESVTNSDCAEVGENVSYFGIGDDSYDKFQLPLQCMCSIFDLDVIFVC